METPSMHLQAIKSCSSTLCAPDEPMEPIEGGQRHCRSWWVPECSHISDQVQLKWVPLCILEGVGGNIAHRSIPEFSMTLRRRAKSVETRIHDGTLKGPLKRGRKKTKKRFAEDHTLELQVSENEDPLIPHDFKSVTLIIRSTINESQTTTQNISSTGSKDPHVVDTIEMTATRLLNWLTKLAELCNPDDQRSYQLVCAICTMVHMLWTLTCSRYCKSSSRMEWDLS